MKHIKSTHYQMHVIPIIFKVMGSKVKVTQRTFSEYALFWQKHMAIRCCEPSKTIWFLKKFSLIVR